MIEATSQGQDYQLMAGKHQMSFFVRAEIRVCQLTIFWIRKNDIITYIGICSIAVSRNPLEILFQCMQQFFKWPKPQTFCELLFWNTIGPTGPQILLVRRWSVTVACSFACSFVLFSLVFVFSQHMQDWTRFVLIIMQISVSATKAYKCMFQPIKTFNLSFLFF